MGQTVFVLISGGCYDYEPWDNTLIYNTRELAREAMLKEIEESKKDNNWWDAESGCVKKGYEFEDDDDSFCVYRDGEYLINHESWKIREREIICELASGKNVADEM